MKKMYLYHAVSMYQILEVILHKNKYHKNDKCILILPDFIVNKFPEYKKIEQLGIFDEVVLFPYLYIEHNRETLIYNLEQAYQKTMLYDIYDFSEIYIAGVHFYFSVYLIEKEIHFFCFEDAARMVFQTRRLYENIAYRFKAHAEIAREKGLIDLSSPFITGVYVNKKSKEIHKKQIVFNVTKELFFGRTIRKKLLILFAAKEVICPLGTKIVLTEQFYVMGKMSKEEQKEIYKQIIEKEIKEKDSYIIVKPHPDDEIDYRYISDRVVQIDRVCPAELLPYLLKGKPSEIISISSSSVNNLKKFYKVSIENRGLTYENSSCYTNETK